MRYFIFENCSSRTIFLWIIYFIIIACAVLPHGLKTPLSYSKGNLACTPELTQSHFPCQSPVPLLPESTNADIIRIYQLNDQASVARAVKQTVESGQWVKMQSPPGMQAIQVFFYWISPTLPIAGIMALITTALWASVFTQIAWIVSPSRATSLLAFVIPLFLLPIEEFNWLTRIGILNTEPLQISFFLLGLGSLYSAVSRTRYRLAAVAGVLFALSAYIRDQTDFVMSVVALLFLLYFIWRMSRQTYRFSFSAAKHALTTSPWLAAIACCLLAYHGATFPYRIANHGHWVDSPNNPVWTLVWQKKENVSPELQYVVADGGVVGCELDPELCDYIYARRAAAGGEVFSSKQLMRFTITSFLHHPLRWLNAKSRIFLKSWFDGSPLSIVVSVMLLALLGVFVQRRDDCHALLKFFLLSTIIGVTAPFLLVHIEPRYILLLRMSIIYSAIMAMSLKLHEEK